jgi:hypothetical protein
MKRIFTYTALTCCLLLASSHAREISETNESSETFPVPASDRDAVSVDGDTVAAELKTERSALPHLEKVEHLLTKLKLNCSIEMQADKEMYNDFGINGSDNRFTMPLMRNYRKAADDFWMRVGMFMSYTDSNLETVVSFRFYPYWTMRRLGPYDTYNDLNGYLDYIELTRAYIKVFKDYFFGDNSLNLHFKVGRDGLLNSCGQLFGNYLEYAVGGYSQSRFSNFIGPFKNRKIFANQLQFGTQFKVGTIFTSKTDLMFGGNLNNEKWYSAPATPIFQMADSKLSTGFFRCYLDLYFLNERLHFGTGYRNYFTKVLEDEIYKTDKWETANWAFDAIIIPDLKFYSEFGYQSIGITTTKTVLRPVTMGLTIPTGKVLDLLAVEMENVAETFFSDKSKRDQVGLRKSVAIEWGMIVEKSYQDRVTVSWGLYPGNPNGDLKTSLRLSSYF